MIRLVLPHPPSVNHIYVKAGRRFLLAKSVEKYRAAVAKTVEDSGNPRAEGLISVVIFSRFPNNRKRDLDNLLKSTLDALTHAGVWGDDSQVQELSIVRGPNIKGGQAIVRIAELEGKS